MRRLILATVCLWLAAAVPAWLLAGAAGLEGLTYALLLCLAPGVVTLQILKSEDDPHQALKAMLLGFGLRMGVVFAGILVLRLVRPDLGPREFYLWLVVGYLVTLAVETRQVLADDAQTRRTSGIGQPTV
ncbi:MAG: hypothetical protein U0992_16650 [Planctomycetaceae bacterium]